MNPPELVLVHGIYSAPRTTFDKANAQAIRASRQQLFSQYADALGITRYEWLDGAGKRLANRGLQKMRGTAATVDAVEIASLNGDALARSLQTEDGRAAWRAVAHCDADRLDPARSFVLMGAPRQQLAGPDTGQKVIWFGNGLSELSRAAFISHYTERHGPLVAGHAGLIGLRRYRQVPDEKEVLCNALRELGLGRAAPPAVFGELVMGAPPLRLSTLRAWRAANREIRADEKRHIDFGRSMLFLPAG